MKVIYRNDTDTMRISFREDLAGHDSEATERERYKVNIWGP